MSLGFLTESALVPSKAKPINVDAKSFVDLKAVVFQKDQERKRRLQEALTAENNDDRPGSRRLGKYAHLRGSNKRRKRSDQDRNRGVEARSRRDEETKQQEAPDEDDDEAWSRKSAEMLRKKAKLYEEMARGEGKDDLKGEFLVDFEAKKNLVESTTSSEKVTVEITDEFGRLRKVAMDSDEYAEFMQTQQGINPRHEVENECRKVDEREQESGSFVVSQWEKRLKTTEKEHLKEVHERAMLAQTLSHSSSSGAVDRKTRKQERLARLRRQKEKAADGRVKTENAQTNAAVDAAASEHATDFLNQLSSLI